MEENQFMNTNEQIGGRIAELRRAAGMSQEQLAGNLGITFQAVSKWECGIASPDIALLPELADIFGVTIDSFFGRVAADKSEEAPETEKQLYDMPWDNDGIIRITVFKGRSRLRVNEFSKELKDFTVDLNGDVADISSELSVSCRNVEGSIAAGAGVNCGNIEGTIAAGAGVCCGNVEGNIAAGGSVSCGNVKGDVDAGGSVNCGDISGDVDAGASVKCGGITGDVDAGNKVECGDISGDVDAGTSVTAKIINGTVKADTVSCDEINM